MTIVVGMANGKNTLVILAIAAAIGIGVAYVLGYVVGISSYPGFGVTGPWFGPGGGVLPSGMMGPGAGPRPGWWGGAMMGPGMMGPSVIWGPSKNTAFIANYAFYPDTLTVKKGTTVTWINMDHVPHTVESGTHERPMGVFTSELLGHMESFSFTFKEPGTYVYYCDPHPYMTAKIIVEG